MMIKISLHLIFVLLYKSTYLWSESEERKKFWGVYRKENRKSCSKSYLG